MADSENYMVIEVRISQQELREHYYNEVLPRDVREAQIRDYLETLGLRPRHGPGGTMEIWDDPATGERRYRQCIPR